MKLLGCHIDSFGGLSNVDINFTDGLNVINRENGWGKSTLTAFIRVMLYGFENEGSRDEEKNERKRYTPWVKADVYGGTLSFEAEGHKYKINAVFGHTLKDDQIEIRNTDTNMVETFFGKTPGEYFFQIDSKSFVKSVFLSQNDCDESVTDEINAKLGNVSSSGDDINNSKKAEEALKKAVNAIESGKKKGRINEILMEKAALEKTVLEKASLEALSENLEARILENKKSSQEIGEQLKEISSKMTSEGQRKDKLAIKEKYEEIVKNHIERENKLADAKLSFPNGVPTDEALNEALETYSQVSLLSGRGDSLKLSGEEEEKLYQYQNRFDNHVPTQEEMIDLKNLIIDKNRLDDKIAKLQAQRHGEDRYFELKEKYQNNVPDEYSVAKYIEMVGERADATQTLSQKRSELGMRSEKIDEMKEEAKREASKKRGILIFLGILLIVIGVVLYSVLPKSVDDTSLQLPVIIGGSVAAVGILVALMSCFVKQRKVKDGAVESLKQQVSELEDIIYDIDESSREFIESLGIEYIPNQVSYCLMNIQNDCVEYKKLDERLAIDETIPLKKKREALLKSIGDEFARYGEFSDENDIQEKYHSITDAVNDFRRINEKKERFDSVEKELTKSLRDTQSFLMSHGFSSENPETSFKALQEKLIEYKHADAERNKTLEEKSIFEQQHPDFDELLTMEGTTEDISISELDLERVKLSGFQEDIKNQISNYERLLEENNTRLGEIADAEIRIDALEEEREQLTKKKVLYEKTAEFLDEAKKNFINKYTGPVQKGFRKYISLLTDEDPDTYYLDINMQLTKEEKGIQRKRSFFSAGQKDAMGISMRMSMIEAMYESEKPFLVMDDPFTNLDDASVSQGLEMLDKISKEYQLIYFTCNESRDYGNIKYNSVSGK